MELLFAIAFFAVSISITPGPNNIMIMSSGLTFGVKKSLPHLLGIASGFTVMLLSIGFGFNVILQKYPIIYQTIKVAGIGYLLYLAYRIATSSSSNLSKKNKSQPLTLIQAAAFQWVNPKAWVAATGAISAYTSVTGDFISQVSLIAIVFFCAAIVCAGSWLVFGSLLVRVLTDVRYQQWFNRGMSVLLVISILPAIQGLVM